MDNKNDETGVHSILIQFGAYSIGCAFMFISAHVYPLLIYFAMFYFSG